MVLEEVEIMPRRKYTWCGCLKGDWTIQAGYLVGEFEWNTGLLLR